MKLTLILFAFFFNFFNSCNINAEEIIDSSNNKIEKNVKGENSIIDESVVEKIHIVKVGDTITSISKFYSIEKDLILQLNNLKNEFRESLPSFFMVLLLARRAGFCREKSLSLFVYSYKCRGRLADPYFPSFFFRIKRRVPKI